MNSEHDRVVGPDGVLGVLLGDRPADPTEKVQVALDSGVRIAVPSGLLEPLPGGGFRLPLSSADLRRAMAEQPLVIPVIEEQVRIGRRVVETGKVRIHKRVTERVEEVSAPVLREEVQVERIAIDRYVDGPIESRMEGDTLVVPVLEEVLVLEKRLVLREEIRITKSFVTTDSPPEQVTLRREEVEVERVPAGSLPPGSRPS